MKILTDKKIKALFCAVLACILVFIVVFAAIVGFGLENAAFLLFLCFFCMAAAIFLTLYGYFRAQSKTLENAAAQITRFLDGDVAARIACDGEGELNKLFHKINSLAATLNAHAEKEERGKEFLKNTISDISHQLKTPLAALNIYNGILQQEAAELPTILEFVGLCEQELDRMETLVKNLLKITKLDAGTILLEKAPENVEEMMETVKKHFSFRAEQEGKEINLEGDPAVALVCDRTWLMEAVDNMVKNALDHTKKGDAIHIQWKQLPSGVQIIVKDSGSGIHPEDLYHIFKRFYRSRFSQDVQGIGLGLPLAKAIIEAMGGSIEVDSQLGRGTTFFISFLI